MSGCFCNGTGGRAMSPPAPHLRINTALFQTTAAQHLSYRQSRFQPLLGTRPLIGHSLKFRVQRLYEVCNMSDNKSKTGSGDRSRINIRESYELRDWSNKFGVTPEELKAAIGKVGTSAQLVEAHLKKKPT
jgi:hypothetical protein